MPANHTYTVQNEWRRSESPIPSPPLYMVQVVNSRWTGVSHTEKWRWSTRRLQWHCREEDKPQRECQQVTDTQCMSIYNIHVYEGDLAASETKKCPLESKLVWAFSCNYYCNISIALTALRSYPGVCYSYIVASKCTCAQCMWCIYNNSI